MWPARNDDSQKGIDATFTTGILYALVSVVAVPLAFSDRRVDLLQIAFLSISVTAIALLVYFSVNLGPLRKLKSYKAKGAIFLATVLTIGISRGIVLWWLTPVAGIEQNSTLDQRIAISVLMTLIWLPAISWLVESNRVYSRSLEVSRNQLSYAAKHKDDSRLVKQIDALELVVGLKENLQSIATLARQGSSIGNKDVAQLLTRQIDEVIRPFSHQFWRQSQKVSRLATWIAVSKSSLQDFQLHQPRLLLGIGLFGAVGSISFGDWRVVAIFSIVPVVWVKILLTLDSLIRKTRLARPSAGARLVFILACGLSSTVLCDAFGVAVGFDSMLLDGNFVVWLAPLPTVMLFYIEAVLTKVKADRQKIISDLQNDLHQANDLFEANLASFLHNTFQSELTSIVLQLKALAENDDENKREEITARLQSLAEVSIGAEFISRSQDPMPRLESLVNSWKGIATIILSVEEKVFSDQRVATVLVPIIEETVTNSIRHGGATTVEIRVWLEAGNTQVEVSNDGSISEELHQGLGSKWISSMSLQDYSPQARQLGVVLRFEI